MSIVAIKDKNGEYLFGDILEKRKYESIIFLWESCEEILVKNSEIIKSEIILLSEKMIIDVLLGNVSFNELNIYPYNDIELLEDKVSLNIIQIEKAIEYLATLKDKKQWIRVFSECVTYNKEDIFDIEKLDALVLTHKILDYVSNNNVNDLLLYFNNIF